MEIEHIDGEDRGKLMLYALSTCGWCRKTKKLLDDLGVAYDFIYVDKLAGDEKQAAREKVMEHNPACSFPTLVIDNERCIVGFKEPQIREELGFSPE